jgi:tetratricopeptide (TPR) repeat protein
MTIDTQLDTLEAKGLVRVAAYQPELEYLFRHALVQDAAYESLLKQERRALHRTVGEALEELYPERRGELAAVLAMHFEQAGDTERAVRYAMEAARFALERNAIVEAFGLFSRAGALLPPPSPDEDDTTRRRRIEIGLGQARSGFTFRTPEEGLAALEPLVPEAEKLGDPRMLAELYVDLALVRQNRGERPDGSPELAHALTRVTEIGEQLGDRAISSLPRALTGTTQVFTGEIREGLAALEEAIPALEDRHDYVVASFAMGIRAIGYARLGEFKEAEAAARRATEVAADGDLIAQLDALIAESTVRSLKGDLAGAVPLAQRCTAWSEETGATACMVASNFVLGDAYMRQGRFEDAQVALKRGNEISAITGFPIFRASIAAWLRATAASLGDFGPASGEWDKELDAARDLGDRFTEAAILAKRAETRSKALAAGSPLTDADVVLADFSQSASEFAAMGARPYLARTLRAWGDSLRSIGHTEDGNEKLRRALALFEEMGIDREAAEVRAELSGIPVMPLQMIGPDDGTGTIAGKAPTAT